MSLPETIYISMGAATRLQAQKHFHKETAAYEDSRLEQVPGRVAYPGGGAIKRPEPPKGDHRRSGGRRHGSDAAGCRARHGDRESGSWLQVATPDSRRPGSHQ